MRARLLLSLTAVFALTLGVGAAAAQAPIKIGDINSYSGIGAPFTGPYRVGDHDQAGAGPGGVRARR